MLYPLHKVDRNDGGEDAAPVLAKANIVTDTYFACDCRSFRDTVSFRTGEGTHANLIIVIVFLLCLSDRVQIKTMKHTNIYSVYFI